MELSSITKPIANKVYNKLAPNLGNMLLITGTAGWILSALAQISAVVVNDKISKDQKKFLIPQEIADAAVNIFSFVVITRSCQKFGERLVKTGKLATPAIRKFIESNKLEKMVGNKEFDISANPAFKKDKDFQHTYDSFFDGASFISSTIGSIVSCNIVTPYARNYLGAKEQKRQIANDKMKNEIIVPTKLVLPAQNRFGIDDYKKKTSGAPLFMPSGSMRV